MVTNNTISAVAARLDALGYQYALAGDRLEIYDTILWWIWPGGEQYCEMRPSVLVDRGDTAPWRWQLVRANGSVEMLRGTDVGDALLTLLRPPGEWLQLVFRSPADADSWPEFCIEPPSGRPEQVDSDWWIAWHTGPLTAVRRRLLAWRCRGRGPDHSIRAVVG